MEPPDLPDWPEEWQQYRAAKAWGLTPKQWRAESVDDRAVMLAMHLFEATVEARRAEHRDGELKRDEKGRGGDNDYRRMKDRLRMREQ